MAMIVRQRQNWLRMLLIWRGSVLNTILPQLFIVLVISSLVTWTHGYVFEHYIPLTATPFTLLGVSLALFLGFRNSASYDRFWEGRKLWGNLLNVSRSLVRQGISLAKLPQDDPRMAEWVALLAAFTHALRHQLRGSDPSEDFSRLLSGEQRKKVDDARYRPAVILRILGEWVAERKTEGLYGEITAAAIDHNLGGLSDVLGGCERLASTPLPYAYSVMIHRTVYIYCFLLPFGLVGTIGRMTPVISVLVAYTFMALEALAGELEEPFGVFPNDLALEHMSLGIEETMREMIGQPVSNVEAQPEKFVLL
jgi:ion channel-forming bestrophin family protein